MNQLHIFMSRSAIVLFGLIVILTGCSTPEQETTEQETVSIEEQSVDAKESSQVITATVTFIDLEGGFYGLMTEDGKKLLPSNLPREFHTDGTVIQFHAMPVKDMQTIQQWGVLVELKDVKLVKSSGTSDL